MLKYVGKGRMNLLHHIIQLTLQTQQGPKDWKTSVIIRIIKRKTKSNKKIREEYGY